MKKQTSVHVVNETETTASELESRMFIWSEGAPTGEKYSAIGKRLADTGVLFRAPRYGDGMILLLANGEYVRITKGADLLPLIVDHMDVVVMKNGKIKSDKLDVAHLNAMLKSESFLANFATLDRITSVPMCMPNFSFNEPGLNDGGPGHRIFYVGEPVTISRDLQTIARFLDEMAFATKADRTNAVAAALTVHCCNMWPGGKPVILATASKSHAGKDTVILFATGRHKSVSISYQATDWAVERSFVGAIKKNPDSAVVIIDNARTPGHSRQITSAFLERFATDPEPQLFSTGSGGAVRVRNEFVLAISTNFGTVSEDLMNRALPIHLHPVGNVADRKSRIGNPKEEFLPANREQIASELYGMIENWKDVGRPLDEDVRHPFSTWAKTIGGILKVNGFTDFLGNYGVRKTADDPLRHCLAILGAEHPEQWLKSVDWAKHVAVLGLTKKLIPPGDQDSDAGCVRGIGTVLSAHDAETFNFDDDERQLVLRLEKKRARFDKEQPHLRFRFTVVEETRKDEGSEKNIQPMVRENPKPR